MHLANRLNGFLVQALKTAEAVAESLPPNATALKHSVNRTKRFFLIGRAFMVAA